MSDCRISLLLAYFEIVLGPLWITPLQLCVGLSLCDPLCYSSFGYLTWWSMHAKSCFIPHISSLYLWQTEQNNLLTQCSGIFLTLHHNLVIIPWSFSSSLCHFSNVAFATCRFAFSLLLGVEKLASNVTIISLITCIYF